MQETIEQLHEQKADVESKIEALTAERENLAGPEKAKATQSLKKLQADLDVVDEKIAVLASNDNPNPDEGNDNPNPDDEDENAKESPTVAIVKNIGNFTLVDSHTGTRFSPGVEVTAVMSPFVEAQLEAKIFIELDK